jgi:hypothetical protein
MDLRVLEELADLVIDLEHDIGRGARRRDHAEPAVDHHAGQRLVERQVVETCFTRAPRPGCRNGPKLYRSRESWGKPKTLWIFQICPVRVTTYAVFSMNSSEVGWSRPSAMTVKLPSLLTSTSAPVFGDAGEPSSLHG